MTSFLLLPSFSRGNYIRRPIIQNPRPDSILCHYPFGLPKHSQRRDSSGSSSRTHSSSTSFIHPNTLAALATNGAIDNAIETLQPGAFTAETSEPNGSNSGPGLQPPPRLYENPAYDTSTMVNIITVDLVDQGYELEDGLSMVVMSNKEHDGEEEDDHDIICLPDNSNGGREDVEMIDAVDLTR